MVRPAVTIDAEIAGLAAIAPTMARAKQVSVLGAFEHLTRDVPRVESMARSRAFNLSEWAPGWEDEQKAGRLRTLRIDLEIALLRLDACCQPSAEHARLPMKEQVMREAWPDNIQLRSLGTLVDSSLAFLATRKPTLVWKQCERIDLKFPRLRICKRLSRLVTRIVAWLPPRPMGVAMNSAEARAQSETLRKDFLNAVGAIQAGGDPAAVNWLTFKPILLGFQNAELRRQGKAPSLTLWRKRRHAPCPMDATAAHVAYLELHLADLLWMRSYWENLLPTLLWSGRIGNASFVRLLSPYWPGSTSYENLSKKLVLETTVAEKRAAATRRKAKSRKKIGEKV